jgi:hypothetical protein
MKQPKPIHADLFAAQKCAYEANGLLCSDIVQESESREYGACTFQMNNKIIKFRVAKITPTKVGQFVTFWKRIADGPIMPYNLHDAFDLLVVSVRTPHHLGQYILPKDVLWQNGLLSKGGVGGKRAMRVYPPWDTADNVQAKKAQEWQNKYFVEINPHMDTLKLQKLF